MRRRAYNNELVTDPKALVEFSSNFRRGVIGDRPSLDHCYMVCLPLETLLTMSGVSCRVRESSVGDGNHFWIELWDGRALDPTLDQFRYLNLPGASEYPPVYLGPPIKGIHT